MGKYLLAAAALATFATPALADDHDAEKRAVIAAVETLLAAQGAGDKRQLEAIIQPDARFFYTREGVVRGEKSEMLTRKKYIRWMAANANRTDEVMTYDTVLISGNVAHVWGRFTSTLDGNLDHCGINSFGLFKSDGRWLIGNSNFRLVPPEKCASVDAPPMPR